MNLSKIQPYLPSKKFQKTIGAVLLLGIIVFTFFYFFSRKEEFSRNKDLEINKKTVYEIIDTDTDGDFVPDWEENLWGTDKNKKYTFGEESDLDYITNKKKALNISTENDDQSLTETELFAREFFTAYTALKGTEGVNESDINNFSNALGQKIANPNITNLYTIDNLKTTIDESSENQIKYYEKIRGIFNKYKESGLGDELEIISKGLLTYQNEGKPEKYTELLIIGEGYQEFAKKASEIEVPETFAQFHLDIINSANNTGISVINMSKVIEDPIIGLSALSSYQKYSEELVNAVSKLEDFLQ